MMNYRIDIIKSDIIARVESYIVNFKGDVINQIKDRVNLDTFYDKMKCNLNIFNFILKSFYSQAEYT